MTGDLVVSWPARFRALAREHPDHTAIRFLAVDGSTRTYSWGELDRWTDRLAWGLAARGVDQASVVVVGLPNAPEHVAVTHAAWKLGALVLPLRHALPIPERDALLALARPSIVVSGWDVSDAYLNVHPADLSSLEMSTGPRLPDVVPVPGRAIGSGGSTGRSKLIVSLEPLQGMPLRPGASGPPGGTMRTGQRQLVIGPLYHVAPFYWMHLGLFQDHEITLHERFDAAIVRATIEDHGIQWVFLSPTMLRRLVPLLEPDDGWLRSLEGVYASGGPFPIWLKRQWAERLDRRLVERYGAAEDIGFCEIDGRVALTRPGSVGRPVDAEVRIVDPDGSLMAEGQVGEIFLRRTDVDRAATTYIGAPPARTLADGSTTVGDLGWLDDDGYLYIADRRTDLIISGDANVYPAEVEGVLHQHPAVAEAVVIGLPDEDWGQRVHAMVQLRPAAAATARDLDQHCRTQLSAYKCPKTWEFVASLPRDDVGKVRRIALAQERIPMAAAMDAQPDRPEVAR